MKKSLSMFGKSAALAAVLLSFGAHADDSQGVYGTLSVGETRVDISTKICDSNCNSDDTDTAFSGAVGYRFNEHVAIEAGYAKIGKFSISTGGSTGSEKVDGSYLGVVGLLPISPTFDMYASFGEYFWHGSVSCNGIYTCSSENSSDVYESFGGTYHLSKEISAGLGWTHYFLNSDFGSYADVLSARLQYQF